MGKYIISPKEEAIKYNNIRATTVAAIMTHSLEIKVFRIGT